MNKRNVRTAGPVFDDDTEVSDVDLAEDVVIVDGERLTDERADEIAADVLAKARTHNANLGRKMRWRHITACG